MEHHSNLILPLGAYKQSNPAKSAPDLDARILGLPHASMASITLHSTFDHHNATPAHLRDQLPPLVEFSSHSKPPGKTGKNQVLVQVYAVAVDQVDVRAVDEKGRGDVGKYVPGRSFVGRALVVGTDEKEVVRGDVVMGLLDIRKVKNKNKKKAAYPGGAFFVKSLTITFSFFYSIRAAHWQSTFLWIVDVFLVHHSLPFSHSNNSLFSLSKASLQRDASVALSIANSAPSSSTPILVSPHSSAR